MNIVKLVVGIFLSMVALSMAVFSISPVNQVPGQLVVVHEPAILILLGCGLIAVARSFWIATKPD